MPACRLRCGFPKGDILAFDARTGEKAWAFHTVPRPGEFGEDTWEDNSNEYTGHSGAWTNFSVDEELGYVYIPVEGRDRWTNTAGTVPATTCFRARSYASTSARGERIWHYQIVHHDIWDWDPPSAPILIDLNVDGQPVEAVIQLSKAAYAFTFRQTNRRTGVRDRGTARAAERRPRRADVANSTFPHASPGF